MTESRARGGFGLVAAYFVLATVANALVRAHAFDARVLDHRAFDFGWELGLPWRASHGEWVGRDFHYPIGPLWQLLAYLGSLGGRATAATSVGGLHVVFPLASLAAAAALACWRFERWRERLLAFGALGLFALHDDVRSFRALVSFAIVLLYAPRGETESPSRAPLWAGALVPAATLLSFETGLLGLGSLGTMACVEALVRGKASLPRLRSALLGVGLGLGVLALVWALAGGSFLRALSGWLSITGGYVVIMVEGGHGLSVGPVLAFVGLGLATLALTLSRRFRSVTASVLLAGALPLLGRAVIRSDAEHVYAALMPLAAALTVVSLDFAPRRPIFAGLSALLVAVFALGWFGSRRDVPTAWAPSGLARVAELVAERAPTRLGYDHDLLRIERYAREHRAGCMVLPERAVVVHALADVPGPTETALRWSPSMKERVASDIARQRCPVAVRQLSSFDFPAPWQSFAFGADFLEQSLRYEPAERLGPATFASRLRAAPFDPERPELPASELGQRRELPVPGRLAYAFGRRVPWDRLLRLEYTLEVPALRLLAGGAPWMKLAFFDGETLLGEVMVLADVSVGARAHAVVPLHAEVAEWRWAAGREARRAREADRLEIIADARPLSPASVGFTLHRIEEIAPPPVPRAEPLACAGELELAPLVAEGRAFTRGIAPLVQGDAIVLDPNPTAEPLVEVFVPVRPCADSCVYAELGVEAGTGGARFEAHVIDDWEKPRVLDWEVTAGVAPKPAQLPLGAWAGREVLVRFGTSPLGAPTARARVYRPRVGPCRGESLVQALHDRRYSLLRGEADPRGDTLRLSVAPLGRPPSELRIPIDVREGTCLAYDLGLEGRAGTPPSAIEVALFRDAVSLRLSRDHVGPGVTRSYRDVSLSELYGKRAEVRIAAWGADPSTVALLSRLRVHRCGDGAPWGFGAGRR